MNGDPILKLFASPKIIGLVGDPNQGKSNLLYWLISELRKTYEFNLYSYGLRCSLGEQKIFSVEELEVIRNSIVIVDEFATLFNLDDRKEKRQIESSFRLIYHNQNVVLLCGLPDNYRKFIAAKLHAVIFKRCTISDFVNGSHVKNVALNYRGAELGSAVLNIPLDQCLVNDGDHWYNPTIPLMGQFDTKAGNPAILRQRPLQKNVTKNVLQKVE